MNHPKFKIVADSAANILHLEGISFTSAPLHVIVGEQDFVDNEDLDIDAMQAALKNYKGKTSTACPGTADWIDAFGDADVVFCATLTSNLSGSYNSAAAAKQIYEQENPGKRVYIVDSLSAGPEITLILEKMRDLILSGKEPEEINREIRDYCRRTHLFFSLASLNNFARNGRINPLIAKGIGVLGIRVVGCASEQGTLQPMNKGRGDKKAISLLVDYMKTNGYKGGKVILSHTGNPAGAEELARAIGKAFGTFHGRIMDNRGLCSYYAEPQSLLLAFES